MVLIYFLFLCLCFLTSDNSHYFPFRQNFPGKSNPKRSKWKVLTFSLSLTLLLSVSLLMTDFHWTWPHSSFLCLETFISYSYGRHAVPKQSYETECSNPHQPQLLQHAASVVQESQLVFPTGCSDLTLKTPPAYRAPNWTFGPFPSQVIAQSPLLVDSIALNLQNEWALNPVQSTSTPCLEALLSLHLLCPMQTQATLPQAAARASEWVSPLVYFLSPSESGPRAFVLWTPFREIKSGKIIPWLQKHNPVR